ncbi:ribonuclease Z, mitochondrial [Cimex lectularius]|uniref:Zinc phosphodiesterase ELAC protein 2 n=1 Tax=Cimex lectularius TaxID=79782 RepID=A0A8I6TE68_CIMLE|nr:ribonuclease Z, mitochondrial [Cimex lectularius]
MNTAKTVLRIRRRALLSANIRLYSTSITELLQTMPKEMTHTTDLRKQRVKLKEKGQKYSPSNLSLQVIGSGAKGAPRSLYLFSDQSRYLFNCGEGTQRLAHEHKMKLSKLEHIFITHASWENMGGLPGVALTIQDVGVPEITLHGPEGVEQIFYATRNFVVLRNLAIRSANCSPENKFEDNAIIVKYIPLTLERENLSEEALSLKQESLSSDDDNDIDYYAHERPKVQNNMRGNKNKMVPFTNPFKNNKHYKPKEDRQTTMCYAVKLQPKLGSLCLSKCVEAGVPAGPLLGKLKNGEDIILPNGTLVRSADVTEPVYPGPVFLVVDCPNEKFLDTFVNNSSFHEYHVDKATTDNVPVLIAHFSPPEIMNNPLYKEWMSKFSFSTQHLLINESNSCMGSVAVHRIQHKLNLLDPMIFPLLNDSVLLDDNETKESNQNGSEKEFLLSQARTFTTFYLKPKISLENSVRVKINPEEYKNEVLGDDNLRNELIKLKNELTSQDSTQQQNPSFIFFGTGSCIPNKVRNTSAILLNVSDNSSILLDCGEGTYGQLVRYFGPEEVEKVLNHIKAVYVSHLHADHHIGLIGLLKAIQKLDPLKKIYLLAPKQIMHWLNLYDTYFESILGCLELIPNSEVVFFNYTLNEATQKSLLQSLNLNKLETAYVKHCPNAFGISLTHSDGWKLTYSGDTVPSDSLVELGKGSKVLIHEATMEDELEAEAKLKLHSTTSQAIEVGQKMEAEYTILTHFSQRYAKLPRLDSFNMLKNVGIAFDNMTISFSDLPKLHRFYPLMKLIFQEDLDELEQKALKRQMRQERENRKRIKAEQAAVQA